MKRFLGKFIWIVAGIVACMVIGLVVFQQYVVAGSGGSSSSSASTTCTTPYSLCVSYGATWRWYSTEGASNPNDIYVVGRDDGNYNGDPYALGGHVTNCGYWGGYYRYAMVKGPGSTVCPVGTGEQCGFNAIGNATLSSRDWVSSQLYYIYQGHYIWGLMYYQGPYFYNEWDRLGTGFTSYDSAYNIDLVKKNLDWYVVRDMFTSLRSITDNTPYRFEVRNWDYESSLSYFCGPPVDRQFTYTLTLVPIDENNNEIGGGNYRKSVSVTYDAICRANYENGACSSIGEISPQERSVTAEAYLDGIYSIKKWRDGYSSQEWDANVNNLTYTTTVFPSKTIYAIYKKDGSRFKGTIGVGDSNGSTSLGPTNTGGKGNDYSITNCSAKNGCEVTFNHKIVRDAGSGQTSYEVVGSDGRNVSSGNSVSSLDYSDKVVLYPGQTYCETLKLKPNGASDSNYVELEICAKVEGSSFEGQITVGDKTIGPSSSGGTGATYGVDNCSFSDGCNVTFTHKINRKTGSDETDYQVLKLTKDDMIGFVASGSTQNGLLDYSDTVTLYPGETVCETLMFKPDNTGSGDTNLTICAEAYGSGQSSIKIEQKKNSDGEYGSTDLYAKPGDVISYKVNYDAGAQTAYNKLGSNMPNWNPGWNNAFAVGGVYNKFYNKDTVGNGYSDKYALGSGGVKEETFSKTVSELEVGKVLVEKAMLNPVDTRARTTPTKVSYDAGGWNVSADSAESSVSVKVPYNFVNNVELADKDGSGREFNSGEDATVRFKITVGDKYNNLAGGSYATIVRNPRVKTVVYYVDGDGGASGVSNYGNGRETTLCDYFESKFGDGIGCTEQSNDTIGNGSGADRRLSPGDNPENDHYQVPFNVGDGEAGKKVCVAVAIYPASSGADDNMNEGGDEHWQVSDSRCYTISKKPTFQVWGGSLYASGTINTLNTVKQSVAGLDFSGKSAIFSSWVEQSVVANDKVTLLASGAAIGYGTTIDDVLEDGQGNYCANRTPLSIANTNCSSGTINDGAGVLVNFDKEKFIERLVASGYTKTEENGSISITSDVTGGKIVFYAKGNINISCNVGRIDAVLIANGDIDTCAGGGDDVNAEVRGNRQLVINGAVYAGGTLKFNRAYGAASGFNSYIPAEIINYDVSLIMVDEENSDVLRSGKMQMVYRKELSPRI